MNVQVTLKSTPIRRSSLTEMGEILEVLVLVLVLEKVRTRPSLIPNLVVQCG
jgi:hypothetical protein